MGPDLSYNGGDYDAFVTKINAQGTSLDYCGYIGGAGSSDLSADIEVDSLGNAYVTGQTDSNESSFPVSVGPDLTHNGSDDAFVVKVDAQGTALCYCGYIGGSDQDEGNGIAVDTQGNTYVTGRTSSDESSFPVTVGPDLTHNGSDDAFLAKVDAQGANLVYCGYVGGIDTETGNGIALDSQGNAYVTGWASSDESSFPVAVGPDLTHNGGQEDVFVTRVNDTGNGLDYCGYIGGDGSGEGSMRISVDGSGNAFVVGWTNSDESVFPVTTGPDLTFNGGIYDCFLATIPARHVLLRAGNVKTGTDNPVDVLFVNGSTGEDCYRKIVNPVGSPVNVSIDAPPGGPAQAAFALYVWPGEAEQQDVSEQPYDLGTACFPMPLSNGTPAPPPLTLVNNIGYPYWLGIPRLTGIPPAPTGIVQNMMLSPGTWTLQGIIFDNNSASGMVSLTNAIVLVQQ